MKYTKQQWLELIQAQQISGASIVDFCREQGLPLKRFYARRSSLLKSKDSQPSGFSKVTVAEKPNTSTIAITLSIGKANISIPSSIDAAWLAKLIELIA